MLSVVKPFYIIVSLESDRVLIPKCVLNLGCTTDKEAKNIKLSDYNKVIEKFNLGYYSKSFSIDFGLIENLEKIITVDGVKYMLNVVVCPELDKEILKNEDLSFYNIVELYSNYFAVSVNNLVFTGDAYVKVLRLRIWRFINYVSNKDLRYALYDFVDDEEHLPYTCNIRYGCEFLSYVLNVLLFVNKSRKEVDSVVFSDVIICSLLHVLVCPEKSLIIDDSINIDYISAVNYYFSSINNDVIVEKLIKMLKLLNGSKDVIKCGTVEITYEEKVADCILNILSSNYVQI